MTFSVIRVFNLWLGTLTGSYLDTLRPCVNSSVSLTTIKILHFSARPSLRVRNMGNTNSATVNRDSPKVHRDLCGLRYDNRFSFA